MATHSNISWRVPMDRGAWWATVHGVTKSWMDMTERLNTNTFLLTWTHTFIVYLEHAKHLLGLPKHL